MAYDTKPVLAEFVAMILFVWIGTGAAVSSAAWDFGSDELTNTARLLTIAIAFGFAISVLAYGIGHISGGHMNPAVTLAFVVLGKQDLACGLSYMAAQCAGATVASILLWGCTSGLTASCEGGSDALVCLASMTQDGGYGPAFGLGVNTVSGSITTGNAFLLEVIGTFVLVFTVLNAAVDSKSTAGNAAPIAIGWSVMLSHIVLVPFTGCGINPARSLGPMVVDTVGGLGSMAWSPGWWVYYTAPFVGSYLAAATYQNLMAEPAAAAGGSAGDKHADETTPLC